MAMPADVFWHNIPDAVWTFTIGGYHVLKEWLSYRGCSLLGRAHASDIAPRFTPPA